MRSVFDAARAFPVRMKGPIPAEMATADAALITVRRGTFLPVRNDMSVSPVVGRGQRRPCEILPMSLRAVTAGTSFAARALPHNEVKMAADANGWLWLVIDVIAVLVLAGLIAYGAIAYRRYRNRIS